MPQKNMRRTNSKSCYNDLTYLQTMNEHSDSCREFRLIYIYTKNLDVFKAIVNWHLSRPTSCLPNIATHHQKKLKVIFSWNVFLVLHILSCSACPPRSIKSLYITSTRIAAPRAGALAAHAYFFQELIRKLKTVC